MTLLYKQMWVVHCPHCWRRLGNGMMAARQLEDSWGFGLTCLPTQMVQIVCIWITFTAGQVAWFWCFNASRVAFGRIFMTFHYCFPPCLPWSLEKKHVFFKVLCPFLPQIMEVENYLQKWKETKYWRDTPIFHFHDYPSGSLGINRHILRWWLGWDVY